MRSDGRWILTIPRHYPVNAFPPGGIAREAGLTPDEFRRLRLHQGGASGVVDVFQDVRLLAVPVS